MKAAPKTGGPAVPAELATLLLTLGALASAHGSDRGGDGAMAIVEYLGGPASDGHARVEALAAALGHTMGYGQAVACDISAAIDTAEARDEAKNEAAASMAATTAPTLRQVARALLLGADELERLAGELEGGAGES
jgi:hypothetical protein